MAEYINREDALLKLMQDGCLASSIESIKRVPIADVVPVVHGRWIHDGRRVKNGIDWCHCSECGKSDTLGARTNYCPNCGAKMDLDRGANHETD